MVECHLAKVDVEGSNPFSRSTFSLITFLDHTVFTPFGAQTLHAPPERALSGIAGRLSSTVFQPHGESVERRKATDETVRALLVHDAGRR